MGVDFEFDIAWHSIGIQRRFKLPNDTGSVVLKQYQERLDNAKDYSEVWQIVKDTVEYVFHKRRGSMMLFLDDLPIQLGAYHSLGTNNIVLNRVLVKIVEAAIENRKVVNALVYNLLLHEYMHALGEISEAEVRGLVVQVCKKCFGEDYVATDIAIKSPWTLLKGIPLGTVTVPKRVMEIVRNFEKSDKYVV
jgi:hypothetical protein